MEDEEENLGRVSRSLHTCLSGSEIIGPEDIIQIRRTTTNLLDDLLRMTCEQERGEHAMCCNGSKADGLRFESSDDDYMYIYRDIKVIPSYSYTTIYDRNTTLLMMENETTKPGYTLLRLIGESTNQKVSGSTEDILNGHYLSCKLWRENHIGYRSDKEFAHGPCTSATIFNDAVEYDMAFCLRSDIWPANAQDCIRRLNQCGWPSHDILISIVQDGFLSVPVAAKQSSFENYEWRLSFSLAERKLFRAMNHTQFLCYGLLKIFLKEAIDVNPDVKGLLCSYFLNTALFWEITTAPSQYWNPSTLLSCFWSCFCLLIHWVSCSYCPNFFIPENNMFEGKIEGTDRDKLLRHLQTLYSEGFMCLLRCPSLSEKMSIVMYDPDVERVPGDPDNKRTSFLAATILHEYFRCSDNPVSSSHPEYARGFTRCLLRYYIAFPTTSHQRFILKTWFHEVMTATEHDWNKPKFWRKSL